MSWTALEFGRHTGRSLPQVMFADPDWFFWAVEAGVSGTPECANPKTTARRPVESHRKLTSR